MTVQWIQQRTLFSLGATGMLGQGTVTFYTDHRYRLEASAGVPCADFVDLSPFIDADIASGVVVKQVPLAGEGCSGSVEFTYTGPESKEGLPTDEAIREFKVDTFVVRDLTDNKVLYQYPSAKKKEKGSGALLAVGALVLTGVAVVVFG